MKKYILLLISSISFAQNAPARYPNITITNSPKSNSSTRIVVQDSVSGQYKWILKNNISLDANVIHKTGNETKSGSLTVNSIIKSGGLANQTLQADGSVLILRDRLITSSASTITLPTSARVMYYIYSGTEIY